MADREYGFEAGGEYKTRGGRTARFYATDGGGSFPRFENAVLTYLENAR